MPQQMITSDRPPGSTPHGTIGCRTGFARTAEQASAMARQLRETGCGDVQSTEIGADERQDGMGGVAQPRVAAPAGPRAHRSRSRPFNAAKTFPASSKGLLDLRAGTRGRGQGNNSATRTGTPLARASERSGTTTVECMGT